MFKSLFNAARIGSVPIKNRIVMPPMVTGFANIGGEVTSQLIGYYAERAKGQVGLIIIEGTYITEERGVARLSIHNDQMIPGLNDLTEAIHDWGSIVFDQLNHQGMVLLKNMNINKLSRKNITCLLDAFRLGALRAKKAGFDGVELHGAHGYLISQFFSPMTNKRNDNYGGSLKKRVTFAKEAVQLIKKEVGKDFPVTLRISAEEKIPGGQTIKETLKIVKALENCGVDAIHVSMGHVNGAIQWTIAPMSISKGWAIPMAEMIKTQLKLPVIAVGRINDPLIANEAVKKGKTDFVAMGRALISDPQLPQKLLNNEIDNVRKCIACNYCIGNRFLNNLRIKCAINSKVGKEFQPNVHQSFSKKKILIVGGGPGGMETARILATHGHEIHLYEKEKELGGNLRYALMPPHKEELKNFLDYLRLQMQELKIRIKLGVRVNKDIIQDGGFDVIILATGSKPIVPKIKGINKKHVIFAKDVLEKRKKVGENVLIIGGGKIGCEVAEFIGKEKKKVSIIEVKNTIAEDVEPITRTFQLERLNNLGVSIQLEKTVSHIYDGKVIMKDLENNDKEIMVDSIVLCVGYEPERALYEKYYTKKSNVFLVGDCKNSGEIYNAVHDAARVSNLVESI